MVELWQQSVSYGLLVLSWGWMQLSNRTDGIISKGFDASLSIGFLTAGIIVLSWYHLRVIKKHELEIEERAEVARKLAQDKDKRTDDLHELVIRQIEVSKDQIQTNKDLREIMKGVVNLIQRNDRL